jgi:CheY-like chemotaxis protein
MAQLIEDLLDISRIISGKMRLDVQQLDLARIIEAAIESVKPAADAKTITLALKLDAPAPFNITGDPTRLQQIVWNLLSNAVKFTPKGGRVDVLLSHDETWAEVRVSDSGKGIADKFLPHVFESFRQEDASHSRSRGGLGLGLAITRQLVELHGGAVDAQSAGEGRGATFTVRLPIAPTAPSITKSSEKAREFTHAVPFDRPKQLRGLRVLVVDDEKDARHLVEAILTQCGCHVTLASSVDEAISAFTAHVPDILISDIAMPERDGYELIRHIRTLSREQGGDVPAAAVTAYARAEDRRNMLNAGFSMHIAKPVEPAELVSVIASLTRFSNRRAQS